MAGSRTTMGLLPQFSELNLHDKETAQGSSVPGHRTRLRQRPQERVQSAAASIPATAELQELR